jgi:hypothetical protein
MNSHGQQRTKQSAKHSAITRSRGKSSLGVNKAHFAYMEERPLRARVLQQRVPETS